MSNISEEYFRCQHCGSRLDRTIANANTRKKYPYQCTDIMCDMLHTFYEAVSNWYTVGLYEETMIALNRPHADTDVHAYARMIGGSR